jgi:hypothetical protein
MAASDHTGNAWLSAFNEVGNKILGKEATEMDHLKQTDVCTPHNNNNNE